MRMRHITAVAALALAGLPAGALAAKPTHPVTPANANANSHANAGATTTTNGSSVKVTFVLRGKVTSYTAGSSLALTLKSTNHERSALVSGSAFTAMLDSKTKVVLHKGAAVANGDMVTVKIRAAKNAPTATLATTAASQVVDQGAAH